MLRHSILKAIAILLSGAVLLAGCEQINDIFGSDTNGGGDSGSDGNDELYGMDANGANQTKLTNNGDFDGQPSSWR